MRWHEQGQEVTPWTEGRTVLTLLSWWCQSHPLPPNAPVSTKWSNMWTTIFDRWWISQKLTIRSTQSYWIETCFCWIVWMSGVILYERCVCVHSSFTLILLFITNLDLWMCGTAYHSPLVYHWWAPQRKNSSWQSRRPSPDDLSQSVKWVQLLMITLDHRDHFCSWPGGVHATTLWSFPFYVWGSFLSFIWPHQSKGAAMQSNPAASNETFAVMLSCFCAVARWQVSSSAGCWVIASSRHD